MKRCMAFVGLLLVLCLSITKSASAAIPINTVVPLTYGNAANYCTVWFEHGEVYSGAYAKIKAVAGNCTPGTEIQVYGDRTGASIAGPRCGLWKVPWQTGCSVTAQGATQSFLGPFHTLRYSRVVLCTNGVSPTCQSNVYGR